VLLAIDIGNTNISCALFKERRIVKNWDIPTKDYSKAKLARNIHNKEISASLICSVVAQINKRISSDINTIAGIKPKIIGTDLCVPLRINYQNPKQLGQDRAVNAYAASQIYGTPVIVASFGTAITLDAVSKSNIFLGGLILPGLEMSLGALASKTAKLPKLKVAPVSGLLGANTKSCILNGVILSAVFATNSLIEKIRAKIGKDTKIIATGGDANLIKKYSKRIIKIDTELTLKGIYLIYKKTKNT